MSEPAQERTEEATPRRRAEARKRGQAPRSGEIPGAVALMVGALVLRAVGPLIWQTLTLTLTNNLSSISRPDLSQRDALGLIGGAAATIGLAVAPVLLALAAAALAAGLLQTNFVFSTKALTPQFDKLNPKNGIKRLISITAAFELLKMSARLTILAFVAANTLMSLTSQVMALGQVGILGAPGLLGQIAFSLIIRVAFAGLVLAAVDYAYQRWHFGREMRMTKQEIRDEQRQSEGDPQIKARIRRLQRQRAKQRMMQEVPKSTVVLANPEHFAVALRYESGKTRAPIVVAKGQDHLAQQIKALARQHGVPVVENPPLARTLFASVPIGREIPVQFYRAIAEVLAFVYQVKRRW